MRAIRSAISGVGDPDDQKSVVQALLLTAATVANAMSNKNGFSEELVKDSAEQMLEVLDKKFAMQGSLF